MNSLTQSSGKGGTNYRYQYRYANSTEVGPRQPMQMEVWLPKGRKSGEWRVSVYAPTDRLYKTWRKVRPGHSHADKLAHSIKMKDVASDRTQFDVCQAYCAWARSAGLWLYSRVTRAACVLYWNRVYSMPK